MTINVSGRRHPEGKTLTEALQDDDDRSKYQRKHGINKRATLVKAADTAVPEGIGATMKPDSKQLAQINQFTRRAVTADEVVCFSTMSMNDMADRDDDFFTTETVKEFETLEAPFSPTGKSYMVDHEYKMANARGRIFDTGTAKSGSSLFLTNQVYVPNTPQYQDFIEGIDFGINWAVSVGVMLNKSECSLPWCKAPFSSYGWWCQNGHDKGMYYTQDAEEDAWGFPLPSDSKTPSAEKCLRAFKGARDFYELSQVFLGAQYDAQIGKAVALAKSAGVPMLGISEEEASSLPIRRLPKKLEEAYREGAHVEEGEDGVLSWKDPERRIWIFDPSDAESGVLAIGKAEDEEETETTTEEETPDGDAEELEEPTEGGGDSGGLGEQDGEVEQVPGDLGAEDQPPDDGAEHASGSPGSVDEPDGSEEEDMDKQAVLALARNAGLPNEVVRAASDGQGNGLQALLLAAASRLKTIQAENTEMKPKAAMGDEYIKSLKEEALNWYIKARSADGPANTEKYERLLDKCSDDVELLRFHIEEQKEAAQAKFPLAVRRSSFPTDPNTKERSEPEIDTDQSERVRRWHG